VVRENTLKAGFSIQRVDKETCKNILLKYHYLKDISKGFKSGYNYGLFENDKCVGVIIFTGFPVPELVKGMFGLQRNEQEGFFELSRLCLIPEIQSKEHNIASWFVSRAIKILRKETNVRSILSYADSDFHSGTVYKACNFKYYGLSAPKKDFWIKQSNGNFIKHSRGKVKGIDGEWRLRSVKHRFVIVFDNNLKILWRTP
jgi:hypothetical protein